MWDSFCKAVNENHPKRIPFKDPLEDSEPRKCTHLTFWFRLQGGSDPFLDFPGIYIKNAVEVCYFNLL